jgi:integrase
MRAVSEQTKTQNEIHLRKYIKPYFGQCPFRFIKPSDVQGFISYLSESSISSPYIRLIFSTLQSIYEFALKDDLVPRNLAIPRHYQFPSLPQGRVSVWSNEQFLAILNQLSGVSQLVALIGATCGLRQGELFGLRIQDLDFENSEITVRQQESPHKYRPNPSLTKNEELGPFQFLKHSWIKLRVISNQLSR